MEVVVSPKYQILIPKEIRKQTNIKKGQKFQVIVTHGIISLVPDRDIKELRGFLKGMTSKGIRDHENRL
jgi:AbrB family looped-hinge helix DNA binding protein